jgi:hypothetical protein
MVTLGIVSRRERQDVGRAEFYAESAALTVLHFDGDDTFGHFEKPSNSFGKDSARVVPKRNNQVLIAFCPPAL